MTDVTDHGEEARRAPRSPVKAGRFLILLALVAGAVAYAGITGREKQDQSLSKWTDEQALPTVALISPKAGAATRSIVLPGDVEAFLTASIHGQTSGYVSEWRVDIGANVKKGEVLAVVDTPELDQQIAGARGAVEKAKANQALAKLTADRWSQLRVASAVSQQSADEKAADLIARNADLDAANSNLDRLKAQKSFADIIAPFDGVVTARNVDIGTLVNTGASSSQPLFTVSDVHKMRIYVPAPENYAADMKNGQAATFELPEYPNKKFQAVVETTSRSIDKKSRTLLVELIADNKDGELSPGSFAQVRFTIASDAGRLTLPASALMFREDGVDVATVDKQGRVELKKVTIVRDFGSEVEISGVTAQDQVVASPPDYLASGQEVRVAANGAEVGASPRAAAVEIGAAEKADR